MSDCYRRAPFQRYDLGSSSVLVELPLRASTHVLSKADILVLDACREFRTMDEHLERVSRFPGVRGRLLELLSIGALISGREIVENAVERGGKPSERNAITWLAMPTRDRLPQLREALGSYLDNFARFGRQCGVLVADASPAVTDRRDCGDMLGWLSRTYSAAIEYAGPEERLKYVDLLAGHGRVPREAAEFGILGCDFGNITTGANRNTILLNTVGSAILQVDDDTRCRIGRAGDAAGLSRTALTGATDLADVWFFEDRESALQFVHPWDMDFLGAHEDLLGRPLPELLGAAQTDRIDIRSACDHEIQHLCSGTGRVVLTTNGLAGDCAAHSAPSLLREGSTRARFTASTEAMRTAVTSREVVHLPGATVISHGGPLMAYSIGLDQRSMLPPFFPMCRTEDQVFAQMVGRCSPEAYFGRLPFTIDHVPPPGRTYAAFGLVETRLSDIVIALISTWDGAAFQEGPADSLRALGSHLMDVAALPPGRFRGLMRQLMLRRASGVIRKCEELLDRYRREPPYWSEYVSAEIRRLKESVLNPEHADPVDLLRVPRTEVSTVVQDLVAHFGGLLYWWPTMIEQARELAWQGVRIGRPVNG